MVPDGYYLPPPIRCSSLAEICAQAGGAMTALPIATSPQISFTLPAEATAELSDFLRPQATLDCPPLILAHLPGGRVFGPGHILSPDGHAIARDVSLDFGKAPDEHWLLTYEKIRQPQPLVGTWAVVATSLGAGYCHWLLEELPRLLALAPSLEPGTTVLAHTRQPFAQEAIRSLPRPVTFAEPARLSHYRCEDLLVPSLIGPAGRPTPPVVDLLNAFADTHAGVPAHGFSIASPFGERLYISREKARRRRVSNESTLWPALESRGFQRVHLEDLTWADQINAFRSAKVIVAPHGAGLANLAFCRPGARVVEFFHRRYVNGLFWQLASLQALDYIPIVAAGPTALAQEPVANRDDIQADVAQILRALERE